MQSWSPKHNSSGDKYTYFLPNEVAQNDFWSHLVTCDRPFPALGWWHAEVHCISYYLNLFLVLILKCRTEKIQSFFFFSVKLVFYFHSLFSLLTSTGTFVLIFLVGNKENNKSLFSLHFINLITSIKIQNKQWKKYTHIRYKNLA